MGWTTQRQKRKKGWYYQALYKEGGKVKRTVALGTLTDEQHEWARANLSFFGDRLLDLTSPELKGTVVRDPDEERKAIEALEHRDALEQVARGDLGNMTLKDFSTLVWKPVREAEASEATVRNEFQWAWPAIHEAIGHVHMQRLTTALWTSFLLSRDSWSGRSRAIAQTAYRACLKYAFEVGAIESVHPFRAIKGSNKTTTPEGEALTPDEVAKVLDSAGTDMHRALFGVCFGQGTRPSEVLRLRWEDVDWEGQIILIRGTKTDLALRTVPMTEATRVELDRYWRKQKKPSNGLVFLWRGKPFASWRKAFKKSVERSGIDPDKTRRIVRYSGRYTFATLGAVASIPKAAMKLGMGHKGKSRILEDRYERIRLQQAQGLMESFPTFGGAK